MDETKEKIIIMNGFSKEEMRELITWYKKNTNLPPAIFAGITKYSIEWKIKDLLNELINEDKEIKKQLIDKKNKPS